jgi:hypothetical protein
VALLLEGGCPWNLQDHEGYTAGEYGMHEPQVLETLLDWGVQAELVLGDTARQPAGGSGGKLGEKQSDSDAYLKQKLVYSSDGTKLLDADGGCIGLASRRPSQEVIVST